MKTNAKTAETTNIVLINKQDTILEKMKHNITASWRKAASSIIETAMLLLEAENTLCRADSISLTKYLEKNNILSGSVISKLRQIARNSVLTNPENVLMLPASYATLYEISKQDVDITARCIKECKISPATQLKDLQNIFPALKQIKIVSIKNEIVVSFPSDMSSVPKETIDEFKNAIDSMKMYLTVNVSGL